MPDSRPPIPAALRREVLVEAGHRCAIPTCRSVPVEVAHIIPWAQVRDHTFDNLIALCPTCHTRYDHGDIDRQGMLQYKANLSVLHGRYSDMEERVLRLFAETPDATQMQLPGGLDIFVLNLLQDGMLVNTGAPQGGMQVVIMGVPAHVVYELTPKGREFILRWLDAQPLE